MTHQTTEPNQDHINYLKEDAKAIGRSNGISAAQYCDKVSMGESVKIRTMFLTHDGIIDNEDDWLEFNTASAFEAEENSRQYSPFEFTAYAFNHPKDENGEDIEDEWLPAILWESYDDGVSEGIEETLAALLEKELASYNLENGEA